MRAVHFGAGNIGRGFIGLLLVRSGYAVCFVDVKPDLVELLRTRQGYTVRVLDSGGSGEPEGPGEAEGSEGRLASRGPGGPGAGGRLERVEGVTALNARDLDAVAQAVAGADLVTTSVGAGALAAVAPAIAAGLRLRGERPLNVIACENRLGAGDALREAVAAELGQAPAGVGFPNAVVDRIVPSAPAGAAPPAGDPLAVAVEPYHEWLVDAEGIVEPLPPVQGMRTVRRLEAYAERKLFGLNTGHAIVAYLGYLRGHRTIDRAVADPFVRATLLGALVETGLTLVRRHGFAGDEQVRYAATLLVRFRNPALADPVERVGRDPLRKLAAGDRLIRPARLALEEGIWPVCLARGAAAGFLFDAPGDAGASELRARVGRDGLPAALTGVSGVEPDSLLGRMIQNEYHQLVAFTRGGWRR